MSNISNLREKNTRCLIAWLGKARQAQAGFFSLKLHLIINHLCEIISVCVICGNTDDQTLFPDI